MSQEPVERTFNVNMPARLSLSNIRGSVEVVPGSDGVIVVAFTKHPSTGDMENTEIHMDQSSDGTVKVETRYIRGFLGLFSSKPCKVDYVVHVPVQCSLDISGVSNSFSASDLRGDFKIGSVSGSVDLTELVGPVHINTISGGVTGKRISGLLDYDTVSGSISFQDARLTQVKGVSVSGHIRMQMPLDEGPYAFNSVSGTVTLVVPPDTQCSLEMNSVSGRIKTTLPASSQERTNRKMFTQIGNGGPSVRLGSVSGNLNVVTEGEDVPVPQPEYVPSASTQEILDRIERGEISVDEGIALMKG